MVAGCRVAQQHRRFPSDHRPVVVQLQPPGTPQPGPRRWRFPNHMLGVEAFKEQLKAAAADGRHSSCSSAAQAWTQSAEWEALKDSAVASAKQLEQQLQREAQREQRRRLLPDS